MNSIFKHINVPCYLNRDMSINDLRMASLHLFFCKKCTQELLELQEHDSFGVKLQNVAKNFDINFLANAITTHITSKLKREPLLQVGGIFKGLKIVKMLGEGASSEVFLVYDEVQDKEFALKVMKPDFQLHSPQSIKRFLREATLVCKIDHANIVKMHDVFVDDETNLAAIIMEYLPGENLLSYMELKAYDEKSIVKIALQIAEALIEMHKNKIIHRDIKPENIVINSDLSIKITDLGIAKLLENNTKWTSLTIENKLIGTPAYSSPEQITDSSRVDELSDIYSFGATLYHMVTGEPPFVGNTAWDISHRVINNPVLFVGDFQKNISPAFANLIMNMLEKSPHKRPKDAFVIYKKLKKILSIKSTLFNFIINSLCLRVYRVLWRLRSQRFRLVILSAIACTAFCVWLWRYPELYNTSHQGEFAKVTLPEGNRAQQLVDYATVGNISAIEFMVKELKISPDIVWEERTPLLAAVETGQYKSVKYLLENGVAVYLGEEKMKSDPILVAFKRKDMDIFAVLLEYEAKSANSRVNNITYMMNFISSISTYYPFNAQIVERQKEVLRLVRKYNKKYSVQYEQALYNASHSGSYALLRELLAFMPNKANSESQIKRTVEQLISAGERELASLVCRKYNIPLSCIAQREMSPLYHDIEIKAKLSSSTRLQYFLLGKDSEGRCTIKFVRSKLDGNKKPKNIFINGVLYKDLDQQRVITPEFYTLASCFRNHIYIVKSSHVMGVDNRGDYCRIFPLGIEKEEEEEVSLVIRTLKLNSPNGFTPLLNAIANKNNFDFKRIVAQKGVNIDEPSVIGYTPLMVAVSVHNSFAVGELIKKGVDIYATDRYGNKAFDLLVKNGEVLDVDYRQIYELLLSQDNFIQKMSLTNDDKLFRLAKKHSISDAEIEQLLTNKVNINSRARMGVSPLASALFAHNFALAYKLLDLGADVNILMENGILFDWKRQKILHFRATLLYQVVNNLMIKANCGTVGFLTRHSDFIETMNKFGQSNLRAGELVKSIISGETQRALELIDGNGDVNYLDENLLQPLVAAVFMNNNVVFDALYEKGATIDNDVMLSRAYLWAAVLENSNMLNKLNVLKSYTQNRYIDSFPSGKKAYAIVNAP